MVYISFQLGCCGAGATTGSSARSRRITGPMSEGEDGEWDSLLVPSLLRADLVNRAVKRSCQSVVGNVDNELAPDDFDTISLDMRDCRLSREASRAEPSLLRKTQAKKSSLVAPVACVRRPEGPNGPVSTLSKISLARSSSRISANRFCTRGSEQAIIAPNRAST